MEMIDNATHQKAETLSGSRGSVPQPCVVAPEDAARLLADRLPASVFVPFLLAAIALAIAYGSSFLLADTLQAAGFQASRAGTVISIGIVATLTGSIFAGRLAERMGILPLIALAALFMAMAMACFASISVDGMPMAYAGGLLIGLGWAIFYMLAPIQLIHCLKPTARLEALTLLSGSQMLGLGVSAPLGHFISDRSGHAAYLVYAGLCLLAATAALLVWRRLRHQPQLPMTAVGLSVPAIAQILRAKTAAPVLMMGLGGCVFTGLSTFQSLYAQSRGLRSDVFFLTFTVTTVFLRFSVASLIGRLPLDRLALGLFGITLAGVAVFTLNGGSVSLYLVATALFAIGYGLTYSTLNAMVVNFAGERGLSVPVASQVFTLGYFIGLFGFPYVAGRVIGQFGIDAALEVMMALVIANMIVALAMIVFAPERKDDL